MKRLAAGAAALALCLGSLSAAVAGQREATETSIVASGPVIILKPGDPSFADMKMTAKYLKRVDGKFKLKRTARYDMEAVEGSSLVYGDWQSMGRANQVCKIVARFPGTEEFAPSKDARKADCRNGALKY